MAYVESSSSPRRTATLIAVAGIHAAVGYGLVSGFAADVLHIPDVLVPTRSWTADPPPPPPAPDPTTTPEAHTQQTHITAPRTPLDLPDAGATVFPTGPLALPSSDPGPAPMPTLDPPKPAASFAARGAIPLGSPGRWATSEDYPARALREGREGVTAFRVTVGADGRVNNCEVTRSSGSPDLDRATCEKVAQRARFKPATDESGAKVAGSYSNAVKWDIPGE